MPNRIMRWTQQTIESDDQGWDLGNITSTSNEEVEYFEREYIAGIEEWTPTIEDYDFDHMEDDSE